jgi:hypothetical protein
LFDYTSNRLQRSQQRQFLQQSISLFGGDLSLFRAAISGITGIQCLFSNEFKENDFEQWSPTMYKDMPSIDASNRYFSAKKDVSGDDHIPFPQAVDPRSILKSLEGLDFVHAADNVVDYYKLSDDG